MTRTFALSSAAGEASHHLAGRVFDMNRVDLEVGLHQTEEWIFQNDSTLPHPVHVHGCHFQIQSRAGGRGTVFPHEGGWKDTALVMPGETVAVRIRFDAYPGLFLLHCHNLQHEDLGMMLNVAVVE
ncbi:MAG TPA: multicopper oxidase domain-containing protein [Gemmatimonadales bacterium]|nr:multicopper oxidase domain-containing protein [Gemmatimonadales bacterium]